jgi:hypothetical protein
MPLLLQRVPPAMAELSDGSLSTLALSGRRFLRSLRLAHAGGAIIVG